MTGCDDFWDGTGVVGVVSGERRKERGETYLIPTTSAPAALKNLCSALVSYVGPATYKPQISPVFEYANGSLRLAQA